ncbi:hemerythrin domain-containing protein [Herbidospora galbida]|uniref:Hemerythrin domain-containing protein n=1 Tax=Herbidospora galbida TaxID=2575442 RepID=A0A4U3MI33_9ACTN|nr:hemerythrin domain-containing protein [Herbidospora galbida]TKK89015.1 hemerythrin domain-containing protein [Herbidospora galbida]
MTNERPYVQEMVMIHRVFRRESKMMPELFRRVRAGDVARAALMAEHYRGYADGLHTHHTGEDDLLWPKLLARVTLEADLVNRMEHQHEYIADTIHRIGDLLPEFERTADPVLRDRLADLLTDHHQALDEHLREEETHILPLVTEHITVAEWNEMGERGVKEASGGSLKQQLIVLGAILEDATPEERAHFMGNLPVPAKIAWNLAGKRFYARRRALVRG